MSDEYIKKLYDSGLSYSQIREQTGKCYDAISKIVKGRRTHKESCALARQAGRGTITEDGRLKLSEIGKKLVKQNGKFWTKPERKFKQILNELGLGVIFSDYVRELYELDIDENQCIFHQYPIQRYVCDFVDVENKVIFRVNGDFWHANPILYDKENLTKIQKFNVARDKNSKIFFEKNGWNVCDVWESEIYWNVEVVKQKIRAMRKLVNPPLLHSGNAEFNSQIAHSDWSERLRKNWFKNPKGRPSGSVEKQCVICGNTFKIVKSKSKIRKCCSKKCKYANSRKVVRPTKKELVDLLKTMSWTALGKKYKVSDNCVKNWAKDYKILCDGKMVKNKEFN